MTTTYGGSITLGQAVPGAAAAQLSAVSSANASLGDVQARVTGLLSLQANLVLSPPNPADLIAKAEAIITSLSAPTPPALPQLTAVAAVLAELNVTLATLTAQLAAANALGSLLATAGIHFYAFEGRADALGSEMAAQLSAGLPGGAGAGESIAGVVLLANDGAAIAALNAVMG